MARLYYTTGNQDGQETAVLGAEFHIGRGSDVDLSLPDVSVSRRHARISRAEGGVYVVVDLDSTNGVKVNDRTIRRHVLADGDQLEIGGYALRFCLDPSEVVERVPPVVRVENVYKEYQLGKESLLALNGVSLEVQSGEFLALAGPSGSGKSTLLNLIGCIDTPTRGSVFIEGNRVSEKTPDQLADLRANTLGFIFQNFNLLPVLTAWENVEYPLLNSHHLAKKKRQARVEYYLQMVGLDRHMHHRPNELSGGQRQRVAIARALATRPAIVLADEPTANLDHATGTGILELMREINRDEGATFIFSTHDPQVMEMADRVVRLSDGEILQG